MTYNCANCGRIATTSVAVFGSSETPACDKCLRTSVAPCFECGRTSGHSQTCPASPLLPVTVNRETAYGRTAEYGFGIKVF